MTWLYTEDVEADLLNALKEIDSEQMTQQAAREILLAACAWHSI